MSARFGLLSAMAAIASICAPMSAHAKICVNAGSYPKLFGTVLRAEVLKRSHELAFEDEKFSGFRTFSAKSDFDLAQELEQNIKQGCNVVVGLYTSHECLLAGPIVQKHQAFLLSPSCGHNDLRQYSPYLYTGVPSLGAYSKRVSTYIRARAAGDVFIFHQPSDVFSEISFSEFKKSFKGAFREITIDRAGTIDDAEIKSLNGRKRATFVFFSYPLPSAQVLTRLSISQAINSGTRIIGSSSWAFDPSVFKGVAESLRKADQVLVPDLFDIDQLKMTSFYQKYKKRFGTPPIGLQFVSYDMTRLAVRCYRQAFKSVFSAVDFQHCLTETTFSGISGRLAFRKGEPFADREIIFMDLRERL